MNILVVVDVQKGFIKTSHTENVANHIESILQKGLFDYVIATRFINVEGSQFIRLMNWRGLTTDTEQALFGNIATISNKVIDKNVHTCVDASFLSLLEKENGGKLPEHVFICGFDTDCCVQKIAVDIFEQGIRPIVLIDYCHSSGGENSHNTGVAALRRLIGETSIVSQAIKAQSDITKAILKANTTS
ncbi:MAG: isochorismatase family protein [Dehalococcoidia bacterium]|nr:isochorismatase family protein [Dehalococcoidia bacterium]